MTRDQLIDRYPSVQPKVIIAELAKLYRNGWVYRTDDAGGAEHYRLTLMGQMALKRYNSEVNHD